MFSNTKSDHPVSTLISFALISPFTANFHISGLVVPIPTFPVLLEIINFAFEFREKAKLLGGFIMISNLFNYNLVSYELVLNYFNGLKEYADNSPKDTIGIYIDTIVSIISSCGKALSNHNKDKFDENFLNIAVTLSK